MNLHSLPLSIPPDVTVRIGELGDQIQRLKDEHDALCQLVETSAEPAGSIFTLFNDYIGVFVVAFVVSLLATPLMRKLAVANGIIDRPLESRKTHRVPIAYLGGVAVYLGIMSAILFTYTADIHGLIAFREPPPSASEFLLPGGVPLSVLLGMTVIMLVGLIDDVMKISPRIKIAGQLVAAAALAVEDVGTKLAAQILAPIGNLVGNPGLVITIPLPFLGDISGVQIDLVYWTGTALIAIFVLGACNASNLIDGLDGLLSGTTAIAAGGLLLISLALAANSEAAALDSPRVVLSLALLGACLGFLPHNFNPATIFLGDAGSLLMGYCTIVIILMLGEQGQTNLVIAGLIIYAVPIIDTTLAIFRRKMSGKSISAADDQHLHHMLKRGLGVKGAVLALYTIAAGFAAIGVALSESKSRITYVMAIVFAAFIGVMAFKAARQRAIEEQAAAYDSKRHAKNGSNGGDRAGSAKNSAAAPAPAAPQTPAHQTPPPALAPPVPAAPAPHAAPAPPAPPVSMAPPAGRADGAKPTRGAGTASRLAPAGVART